MKESSFLTIPAVLRTRLDLNPTELIVCAVINGFSHDGKTWFYGGIDYLSEWTGTSRRTVIRVLKELVERNILEKREELINNVVKKCSYRFNSCILENYRVTNDAKKDVPNVSEGQIGTLAEGQIGTLAEGQIGTLAEGQIGTKYNSTIDNKEDDNIDKDKIEEKEKNILKDVPKERENLSFDEQLKKGYKASSVFGFTAKGLEVREKVIERTDRFFSKLVLPFQDEEFQRAVYILMTQPKWRIASKTLSSMQGNLNGIAKYPRDFALKLVKDSISKNWGALEYDGTPRIFEKWKKEIIEKRKEEAKRRFYEATGGDSLEL